MGVSLPARGEWIEILLMRLNPVMSTSLPARGEWIEIVFGSKMADAVASLPARGEWIEMPHCLKKNGTPACLSPHGESGLKWAGTLVSAFFWMSLPTRRKWSGMGECIEIGWYRRGVRLPSLRESGLVWG